MPKARSRCSTDMVAAVSCAASPSTKSRSTSLRAGPGRAAMRGRSSGRSPASAAAWGCEAEQRGGGGDARAIRAVARRWLHRGPGLPVRRAGAGAAARALLRPGLGWWSRAPPEQRAHSEAGECGAQVSPPPSASSSTRSPRSIRPSAIGIGQRQRDRGRRGIGVAIDRNHHPLLPAGRASCPWHR